jgi:hypothetical protein
MNLLKFIPLIASSRDYAAGTISLAISLFIYQ